MSYDIKLLSWIKTIYFNFRYLPLKQAFHMPIRIQHGFKVLKMKGRIILNFDCKNGRVLLGYGGSPALQTGNGGLWLDIKSSIVFDGNASIGEGTVIRCEKGAKMEIGENFYCNKNNYFRNSCGMSFGNDCSLGWNNTFNTSDGHYIGAGDDLKIREEPIVIGNHVWITTHCHFLRGSRIMNDSVVSTASVVCKQFNDDHVIIGGVPAKVIKNNINWEK